MAGTSGAAHSPKRPQHRVQAPLRQVEEQGVRYASDCGVKQQTD